MATVTFYKPVNMATAQTFYGTVTGATPTQLTITDGYNTGIYFGSFSYTTTDVYGTMTGYESLSGSSINYVVSGLNVDAHAAEVLIQGNQLQSLFQVALQGINTIYGSTGSDVILTYNGNNTVYGDGGSDLITGGTGFDTLVLRGNKANYTITDQPGAGVTVTDTAANRDGTAQVTSFSYLKFADQGVVLTPNANTDAAEIAMLYAAALGRAPDLPGLMGWVMAFANDVPASAKAGGPVVALAEVSGGYNGSASIAAGFTGSAEFQNNYGTLDNGAFATLLYHNVLGRAPDPTGYNGWVDALNIGAWTREMVLVGFATSPENYAHVQALGWLMQY